MEKIVVITGAGISVESGIQPFRGKNGVWEENPMEMATYHKFITEPDIFLNGTTADLLVVKTQYLIPHMRF